MVWDANTPGTVGENPILVGRGPFRNHCGAGQAINRRSSPHDQHYAVGEIHAELLRLGVLPLENDSALCIVSPLPAPHSLRSVGLAFCLEWSCRPSNKRFAHTSEPPVASGPGSVGLLCCYPFAVGRRGYLRPANCRRSL